MSKYFVYSPDTGFDLFNTADEARKAAEDSLECYRDQSNGEPWDEEVEQICWGEVKEVVSECDVRTVAPGDNPDFEYFCDFQLTAVEEES